MKKRIYIFISLLVIALITFIVFKMFFSKSKDKETINFKSNQEILNGYIYETRNKFVDDDDIEQRTIVCDALKKVKYVKSNYIITTDNELYELNLSQKYSTTNQNCKKTTNIKMKKFLYGNIVVSEDNKFYRPDFEQKNIYNMTEDYYIKELTPFMDDNIITVDNKSSNTYEVLKTDGKVYTYLIDKDTYKILSQEIKCEIPGEIIKSYSISEEAPSHTYIITDKGFYTGKLKNSECEDYVDIKCEYEYIKEEYFSRKVNEIALMLGYSGYTRWGELNYYNSDGKFVSIKKTAK